ncbi:MAG TPA: LptF/LptG family permease [Tepidisphaeraceae bacterium]|nr:LptF/LptG family permease [Tepidisphaeraceae bacterium]
MSRTLFIYIFRDLFRIFMMASGAMAGIMSFGGLLRPLTREGLDAGQVARMLTYFGPAMTTYSFPVAALFATAVVYGRLSADNELTACKAGGVSLLSLSVSGPALVLGLLVAMASMVFLCFIVPASTLKVEKVIYSNLAKLVEGRIERNHEIRFQQSTIFAQEAHVVPPGPDTPPGQQVVELLGPTVVSMEWPDKKADRSYRIPKEFYTASRAFVYIKPQADGEQVSVTIHLTDGFKFPRRFEGATEVQVNNTVYGPTNIPSPIKEDVKFMDVFLLKELYEEPSKSRKVQKILGDFVEKGQKIQSLTEMSNALNGPGRKAEYEFETGDRYSLSVEGGWPAIVSPDAILTVNAPIAPATRPGQLPDAGVSTSAAIPASVPPPAPVPGRAPATAPATAPSGAAGAASAARAAPVQRPIFFRQNTGGQGALVIRAASVIVHAQPVQDVGMMNITVDLKDCEETTGADALTQQQPVKREEFTQYFKAPMSAATKALAGRDLAWFESPAAKPLGDQTMLRHEKTQLINCIVAEGNGRASFAISCLILVMVGAALGMMFRSGNFLTAFAVSFVPALLSITLIIAGQRTAANLPLRMDGTNPLNLGLALIWSGNAVNLLLAVGLLWKLQRR